MRNQGKAEDKEGRRSAEATCKVKSERVEYNPLKSMEETDTGAQHVPIGTLWSLVPTPGVQGGRKRVNNIRLKLKCLSAAL